MSLLFNTLSRFVIAFLPRSKHILISCLHSPPAVFCSPRKSVTVSTFFPLFPIYLPWSNGTGYLTYWYRFLVFLPSPFPLKTNLQETHGKDHEDAVIFKNCSAEKQMKKASVGTSLVANNPPPSTGMRVQSLVRELWSHIQRGQLSPCTATKTQSSQNQKKVPKNYKIYETFEEECLYLFFLTTYRATQRILFRSVQFSSVTQSCPTLCNPMNRSTPGLPVHHQLPEFTQTHVHRVSDAIQPSHPLSSPSPPAPNPSQHQSLFQ